MKGPSPEHVYSFNLTRVTWDLQEICMRKINLFVGLESGAPSSPESKSSKLLSGLELLIERFSLICSVGLQSPIVGHQLLTHSYTSSNYSYYSYS